MANTFTLDAKIKAEIAVGVAHNKVRRLQRQWDQWFPLRQTDPLRGMNAEQAIAEDVCAKLAPKLLEAKRELTAAEAALDSLK